MTAAKSVFTVCAFLFVLASRPCEAVHIDAHIDAKLHMDKVVKAERSDEEVYEGYSHSHMAVRLIVPEGLSLETEIVLEGEPGYEHGERGGQGAFFGEHELVFEEFTLNFEREFGAANFFLYGGKFAPVVHLDSEEFSGVYGYRLTREYEIEQRIGLGGGIKLNAEDLGKHGFDASFFAEDTTIFSNVDGMRRHRRDGGVSNTGDLSSYALSLSGGDFHTLRDGVAAFLVEGFSYRIGYAKQARGAGGERDESRWSFSARRIRQLTENFFFNLAKETVIIKNFEGQANRDIKRTSFALDLDWKLWTPAGGYALIENSSDRDGSIFNFSLSRAIGKAKIGIGYQRVKDRGEVVGRIGTLLSYEGGFSSIDRHPDIHDH